jgi:hypothetical protein
MLMSDSSDSDEERSGTSDGILAAGSDRAGGAIPDTGKALGWSATPCAECTGLRFLVEVCSFEGVYVRSWRSGSAQTLGSTTIGARS